MKCRIFTLLFAFLAIAGNAVWGQSTITINGTSVSGEGSGTKWKYNQEENNNVLTILSPGSYSITANGQTDNNTNIQFVIATKGEYEISLNNVRSDAQLGDGLQGTDDYPKFENHCAFQIGDDNNTDVKVTLKWTGWNKFWSSPERAGINVKPGAKLILAGSEGNGDSLEAGSLCNQNTENTYGAGIGGDKNNPNFGTIIVESGYVKARCESKGNNGSKLDALAAGIGGGYSDKTPNSSTEGTIIIKGGKVEAASWSVDDGSGYSLTNLGNEYSYGAGIGGGWKGTCTNIAILGGEVIANSKGTEDIGVGKNYTGTGITQGIIIGQWNDDTSTAPVIAQGTEINDDNIVDGRGDYPSVTGNVTMPEETQIYVPNAPIIPSQQNDQFNVYHVELSNGILGDEFHTVTGTDATKKIANYYYGAGQSFTVNDLSCNESHLFLGWFENTSNMVVSSNGNATFTMPETTPTSPVNHVYAPVWVNNEYEITVKTGTSWVKDETKTPRITYSPDGSSDVLEKLEFAFSINPLPDELSGLTFNENQLITTTPITLQNNETYKECEVKATVSFNNGATKEIKITITIVDEIMINSINVATINHVYNGQLHNGTRDINADHVLDVKMTHDITGNPLATETSLSEGVHYRIYKYSFEGGAEQTASGTTESLPIKDAGTYSNITIQAIGDAVLTDENYLPIAEGTKNLGNATITVSQRPMNIDISLPKLEEGKTPTWADLKVDIEKPNNNNRGLVDGEDINVSGDVAYTLNEEGTEATITVSNIQIVAASSSNFKESNYEIEVNDDAYTNQLTITLIVPISPKEEDDNDRPGHIERPAKYYNIYIDTVCPGLKLELSKDVVKEGGQVSVYLTVEEQCDTTGFAFEYKRGLFGRWEDLKPLEGVQPGEYIIKHIYTDIYIRALDAIVEEEEEPTGIEDVEGVKVYAQDGNIYVYTPNRERVMIVSMNGALVKNAEQEGMQSYSVSRGIYIVRIGDKVFKIKN